MGKGTRRFRPCAWCDEAMNQDLTRLGKSRDKGFQIGVRDLGFCHGAGARILRAAKIRSRFTAFAFRLLRTRAPCP